MSYINIYDYLWVTAPEILYNNLSYTQVTVKIIKKIKALIVRNDLNMYIYEI